MVAFLSSHTNKHVRHSCRFAAHIWLSVSKWASEYLPSARIECKLPDEPSIYTYAEYSYYIPVSACCSCLVPRHVNMFCSPNSCVVAMTVLMVAVTTATDWCCSAAIISPTPRKWSMLTFPSWQFDIIRAIIFYLEIPGPAGMRRNLKCYDVSIVSAHTNRNTFFLRPVNAHRTEFHFGAQSNGWIPIG